MAAKKGKPTRYQRQQKFWLNGRDKKQNELANWCDELRESRRFTTVARNGLTLMRALEQGDTNVLFQLFPNLYETLYAQMEADVLERREDVTVQRLGSIEQLLAGLTNVSTISSQPLQMGDGSPGIRQMSVPQFDVRYDDEEEESSLEVVAAKVDGATISANFLRSLGTL